MNYKLNKLLRIAIETQSSDLYTQRVAGRGFTSYTCLSCEQTCIHNTTNTPYICEECVAKIKSEHKSRLYAIDQLSNFIRMINKFKKKTLLDGRIIQSRINQDLFLVLGTFPESMKGEVENIIAFSELEQDSLNGIKNNLLELKQKLESIFNEIILFL